MRRTSPFDPRHEASRRLARAGAGVLLVVAVLALHAGLIGTLRGPVSAGPANVAPVHRIALVALRPALDPSPTPRPSMGDASQVETQARSAPRAPAPAAAAAPAGAELPATPAARHRSRPRADPMVASPAMAAEPPTSVLPADDAAMLLPLPPRGVAPMPDDAPPVYATRLPPPAALHYRLRRGDAVGEALLRWLPAGERYELQLQATLPQGATIEQRSQGGFDAAGLAPERLADRRRGRAAQAANFQRAQGRITFSGPRWEYPLVDGVQDRLSWLVQLAAVASAQPLAAGEEVSLQVVGARGATARWRFRVAGPAQVDAPEGARSTLHLVREPAHLYDLRIEVWLDPARSHWPIRLRQIQVPGGEALEWWLEAASIPDSGT